MYSCKVHEPVEAGLGTGQILRAEEIIRNEDGAELLQRAATAQEFLAFFPAALNSFVP